MAKEKWIMPAWMEPYRESIVNTSGNPVEEMMMDDTDPIINLPRAVLAACVKSQVSLLFALHRNGALVDGEEK